MGTKATSPRSTFAKKLAQMKTSAEGDICGAANMTTDKCVEFQVHSSNAETEATTWRIANIDRVANQLEREIYDITLNEEMHFKKEFSIALIEYAA